jgi:DNA-binding CsgD family transcriptional regulator
MPFCRADDRRAAAILMREQGMTLQAIADKLDISIRQVSKILATRA